VSNPFREKLLSIGVLSRGRTRDRVREGRDDAGYRTKATTDELGNTVTEHADPTDRVDVTVRPPHVRLVSQEVPQDG
jgi:hypothetical protein